MTDSDGAFPGFPSLSLTLQPDGMGCILRAHPSASGVDPTAGETQTDVTAVAVNQANVTAVAANPANVT